MNHLPCPIYPLLALVFALVFAAPAYAASGTVYSCTVVPCYKHPYSGEIEDSGGKSAQATGQAMAESCLSGKGMLEVTDSGSCYLTLRLGLIDFTRDQAFQVQKWGSSKWSNPKLGVTAKGKDSNGTTNDVCIQVPSQKSVVRVSMYVESMGRDVVFYCYPKGFKEGKPKGFKATRVTSASVAAADKNSDTENKAQGASGNTDKQSEDQESAVKESSSKSEAKGKDDSSESSSDLEEVEVDETTANSADELVESSVTSNAQGLSLSTATEVAEGDGAGEAAAGSDSTATSSPALGMAESVVVLTLSIVISGLILMAAAAGIVYCFRRNWNRWGGSDPDDYSELYGGDDE